MESSQFSGGRLEKAHPLASVSGSPGRGLPVTNSSVGKEGSPEPASSPEWPPLNACVFTQTDKHVPRIPQSDSYRVKGGQMSRSENSSCVSRRPATWSGDRHWDVQGLKRS